MKKVIVVLLVVFCAALAVAQDAPKVSIFGGYQYTNVDTKDLAGRQNLNGWDADVAFHATKHLAIVGDVSGAYKTESADFAGLGFEARLRVYNYLFGPRFTFESGKVTPFVEALFGAGHVSLGASATGVGSDSISSNGFAMALGGGLDINANKHFGVRVAKFDYLMNHISADSFGLNASENLNNYRFATGIVFKF